MDITLPQVLSVFDILKTNKKCTGKSENFFSLKPKHLKLLDGLALLAVTEGSHDVAAVTMTNEAEGNRTISEFHFTKNRDFSTDEVDYLHTLCGLLNSCPFPPSFVKLALQDLILRRCRQKIISRQVKLQKTVKEHEESIPSWEQPNQKDVDKFSRVYPTAPGMMDDMGSDSLWSFFFFCIMGSNQISLPSSNRPKTPVSIPVSFFYFLF